MTRSVLKAICGSKNKPLVIGDIKLACYVLEDGTRVFSGRGMQSALEMRGDSGQKFVKFMLGKKIGPLVSEEMKSIIDTPIEFSIPGISENLGTNAYGYDAGVMPEICNLIIDAYQAGLLTTEKEKKIYEQSMKLIRAFAHVGVIALIDEVTGYQEIREKAELQKILKAYISPDLLPRSLMFPKEFYEEIYRLNGREFDPKSVKRPGVIGKYTNKYVYDELPAGVLKSLKARTPKSKAGNYLVRFHQRMTEDIGNPHLKTQISIVYRLMKSSLDWDDFKRNFSRAFSKNTHQAVTLDFDFSEKRSYK